MHFVWSVTDRQWSVIVFFPYSLLSSGIRSFQNLMFKWNELYLFSLMQKFVQMYRESLLNEALESHL